VCGTCRAHVSDGVVDLRRNYALGDDELERGFVLTCQSYPVSDAVTVDFGAPDNSSSVRRTIWIGPDRIRSILAQALGVC
ncbi:MAG: 2Fe-2S iron-sulfur cluster binding domain-containing protein, partial [Geodermatophilaceae bacterium]|nr:2Fe-2S iron-sulfur cluster binding domain-containing protein [Geodermatophilaceae bacterium]